MLIEIAACLGHSWLFRWPRYSRPMDPRVWAGINYGRSNQVIMQSSERQSGQKPNYWPDRRQGQPEIGRGSQNDLSARQLSRRKYRLTIEFQTRGSPHAHGLVNPLTILKRTLPTTLPKGSRSIKRKQWQGILEPTRAVCRRVTRGS